MRSKIIKELMELLQPDRIIDQPRKFTATEVEKLVEIAELELIGDIELLKLKIEEFKKRH